MVYLHGVLSDGTLAEIQTEATRAHVKHGRYSMFGDAYDSGDRLAILMEEVGEVSEEAGAALLSIFVSRLAAATGRVAHELTYDAGGPGVGEGRKAQMQKELIQVAAMAASWYEFLEEYK